MCVERRAAPHRPGTTGRPHLLSGASVRSGATTWGAPAADPSIILTSLAGRSASAAFVVSRMRHPPRRVMTCNLISSSLESCSAFRVAAPGATGAIARMSLPLPGSLLRPSLPPPETATRCHSSAGDTPTPSRRFSRLAASRQNFPDAAEPVQDKIVMAARCRRSRTAAAETDDRRPAPGRRAQTDLLFFSG